MERKVVLVSRIEGVNWRPLGRCGIVSVSVSAETETEAEEEILLKLVWEEYKTIQEFTPGAIELEQARQLALENQGMLPVYLDMGATARRIA